MPGRRPAQLIRRPQSRGIEAPAIQLPPAVVYGLTDFGGTDDRLASAFDQGITGDVAGFWLRIFHRIKSQAVTSTTRRLVWNSTGGNGYYFYTNGTNGTIEGAVVVTGVVTVVLPALTLLPAMVDKLIDTLIVWDPVSGRLRHYYQGIEIGTGTASALSYLMPTGRRMSVGHRDNGTNFADQNTICGIEGGDGFIPSAAEVLAAHNATKARVLLNQPPLAGISGKTTWRANQGATWNPPVIWDDEIANEDLTMVVGAASGLSLVAGDGVFAPPL
jgi:hypothetical protein